MSFFFPTAIIAAGNVFVQSVIGLAETAVQSAIDVAQYPGVSNQFGALLNNGGGLANCISKFKPPPTEAVAVQSAAEDLPPEQQTAVDLINALSQTIDAANMALTAYEPSLGPNVLNALTTINAYFPAANQLVCFLASVT